MRSGIVALIAAALVGVTGCSDDDTASGGAGSDRPANSSTAAQPGATSTTAPAAKPPPAARLEKVTVALKPLADMPLLTAMATRPADGSLYFTSQTGEVWRLGRRGRPVQVLDLTNEVSEYLVGSERGLLGIAFHPVDGRLFLAYTDTDVDSWIVSYAVDDNGRPVLDSRREVFFEDQPQGGVGHKGGGLAFTPDGTLFHALGDGGASNGADAQDYSKVLGGVIRIVPRANRGGYRVPRDNPYVGQRGTRPEIWVKGLRNPWGLCRDAATGDLWTADVGNNTMEEIDRIPAGTSGQNFGWPYIEGTQVNQDGAPDDAAAPVWAYRHDEVGPAAIGGCVYRGTKIPKLRGAYVFGDLSGPLFAIGRRDKVVRLDGAVDGILTGFGVGPDGEYIVLTHENGAFRLVPG